MSDQENTPVSSEGLFGTASESQPNELDMLKQRARLMGITFSNNIGVDTLRAKIQEKLAGEAQSQEPATAQGQQQGTPSIDEETKPKQPVQAVKPAKPKSLRQALYDREMRLVRLRIQNLDPKKANLPGEIFTFANEYLGTVRKFIPYGEATDNGYHVPYCIYKQLRDRKFLHIKVNKVNGREQIKTSYVREFSLEVLPPLTTEELARLRASQAAKGDFE